MAEVSQSASPAGTADGRPCPECGGHLEWSAARQALACPYCGTVVATFSGRGRVDGKRGDRAGDARDERVGGNPSHAGDGEPAAGATEAAGNVGAAGMSAEDRSLVQEAEALFGRGVPDHHALYEQDLEAALRNPANLRNWGAARHEVKCQNCHAISVFVNGCRFASAKARCVMCCAPGIGPAGLHRTA